MIVWDSQHVFDDWPVAGLKVLDVALFMPRVSRPYKKLGWI